MNNLHFPSCELPVCWLFSRRVGYVFLLILEGFFVYQILNLFLSYMFQYFLQPLIFLWSAIFCDNKDIRICNQTSFSLWHLGYVRRSFPPQFYRNILLLGYLTIFFSFSFYILSFNFSDIYLYGRYEGENLAFIFSRWMISYSSTVFLNRTSFPFWIEMSSCYFPQYLSVCILGFSVLAHWPINLFLGKCHTVLRTDVSFMSYSLLMHVFYLFGFFLWKYLDCY